MVKNQTFKRVVVELRVNPVEHGSERDRKVILYFNKIGSKLN